MINEDTVLAHNSGPGASQSKPQITVQWVLIMVNQAAFSYRTNEEAYRGFGGTMRPPPTHILIVHSYMCRQPNAQGELLEWL